MEAETDVLGTIGVKKVETAQEDPLRRRTLIVEAWRGIR